MKRNGGFELVEMLIWFVFLSIISSVVALTILGVGRCDRDPTNEGCDQTTKKEQSSIADKFDRTKTVPVDTTFNPVDVQPTVEQICGDIQNQEAKSNCEEAFDRDKNIQDCISRYLN